MRKFGLICFSLVVVLFTAADTQAFTPPLGGGLLGKFFNRQKVVQKVTVVQPVVVQKVRVVERVVQKQVDHSYAAPVIQKQVDHSYAAPVIQKQEIAPAGGNVNNIKIQIQN
jgi:hypothetical protein